MRIHDHIVFIFFFIFRISLNRLICIINNQMNLRYRIKRFNHHELRRSFNQPQPVSDSI